MKNKNVKIGMRVVPFQKTAGVKDLSTSPVWKASKKDFLYVTGQEDDGLWVLDVKYVPGRPSGDFFNAKDFKPYREEVPLKKYVVEFYFENIFKAGKVIEAENERKAIKLAQEEKDDTYRLSNWCSSSPWTIRVHLQA
jgi:hypothetical protein